MAIICALCTYLNSEIPGGGTSVSVAQVTALVQQNGGFQKKLVKEEEPDDDYLCKTSGHTSVQCNSDLV